MARRDARRGRQSREIATHVETGKFRDLRRQQRRVDAGQVASHGVVERAARATAQRVEDGAVDLGRAEIRDQRVEVVRRPLGDQFLIMRGEMAEGGAVPALHRIGIGGEPQRETQLLEILLIGQREALVEPLRNQHLGRRAPLRAAIGKLDTRAYERLWRLGQRDHAEPERQAKAHRPLVQMHFSDGEYGRGHVGFTGVGRSSGHRSVAPLTRQR